MNYGMTEDAGIGAASGRRRAGRPCDVLRRCPDPQAALDKIEGAGGKTVVPVTEMEMVTFAMFTDPEDTWSGLYKSTTKLGTRPGSARFRDIPIRGLSLQAVRSARSFGSTRSPSSICSSCSRYPACKEKNRWKLTEALRFPPTGRSLVR